MDGPPLTPFSRERMRNLCRLGWTATEIARDMGYARKTVCAVLHDAGLISPEAPENPVLKYSPLPVDEEELTPNQREERRISLARAFEAKVDYEMTIKSAKRDLSMSTAELMRRDKLTEEQARFVQRRSHEFLKMLHLANKKAHA